jgi:hypothetical protein
MSSDEGVRGLCLLRFLETQVRRRGEGSVY